MKSSKYNTPRQCGGRLVVYCHVQTLIQISTTHPEVTEIQTTPCAS